MRLTSRFALAASALLPAILLPSPQLHAQAAPTVSRSIDLSVFAGLTGSYIGIGVPRSKNLAISAGLDVGLARTFFSFRPEAEVRGMYDVANGQLAGVRNFMGGVRLERPLPNILQGRLTPYANLDFGRGEYVYTGDGRIDPTGTLLYQNYPATMEDVGGGFNYRVFRAWSFKADFQAERYNTFPVTYTYPHVWATTFGATYNFSRNDHVRGIRH